MDSVILCRLDSSNELSPFDGLSLIRQVGLLTMSIASATSLVEKTYANCWTASREELRPLSMAGGIISVLMDDRANEN